MANITGTASADILIGTAENDVIDALGGNDQIYAGVGNVSDDIMAGGDGNDIIGGGAGNDILIGDNHDGVIDLGAPGDDGANTLFGGDGDDLLITGGYSNDGTDATLAGAVGGALSAFITGTGGSTAWAGAGNDIVYGGFGNDVIGAGAGNDEIYAGAGDDIIYGGRFGGNKTLNAGAGNDIVFGGTGNAIIDAGAGDDQIFAGAGTNSVTGGAGADTFGFGVGNTGNTTITDFTLGDDILGLQNFSGSFADVAAVIAAMTDSPDGVVLTLAAGQTVTFTGRTISDFNSSTDAWVNLTGTPEGLPTGSTFTLTPASGELLNGTAGNDTFNGVVGTSATVNNFDSVNGLGGTDTVNLVVDGAYSIPASASFTNVEILRLAIEAGSTGTVDADDFGGLLSLVQTGDVALNVEGLASNQTVTFSGPVASLEYDDFAASATVQLNNVDHFETLNVDGIGLTSLTINGSIKDNGATPPGAGTLFITTTEDNPATPANDGSNIETVTVNVTSDVNLGLNDLLLTEDFVMLDASGSTGGIEVTTNFVSQNFLSTILTGTGDDEIYFDQDWAGGGNGGVAITIDAGAGDDNVSYAAYGNPQASTASITLGAGSDKLFFTENAFFNVVDASAANFADSLITVTDFNTAEDVLDVSDVFLTFETLINTEISAISGAGSLHAALVLATSFIGGGNDAALFSYGGNAYIVHDFDDSGTFSDDDGLIELIGVSAADLDATNFVF